MKKESEKNYRNIAGDKRGVGNWGKMIKGVLITVAILGVLFLIIYFAGKYFGGSATTAVSGPTTSLVKMLPSAIQANWLLSATGWLDRQDKNGFIGKSRDTFLSLSNDALGLLGFNQGFGSFLGHFFTGLFAGLLLWALYFFAQITTSIEARIKIFTRMGLKSSGSGARVTSSSKMFTANLEKSWLGFIAGGIWKPIVVGAVWACLMMIPFIKAFLDIITFNFLGINPFARVVLIALYIGIFPTAFEMYHRYKLRRKYYEAIVNEKYGRELEKARRGL